MRLLPISKLPESLWIRETELLQLPPTLAGTYLELVKTSNLQILADARQMNDSPVGGVSKEETDIHFAQAFDGSCARLILSLLDPKEVCGEIPNTFIKCLSASPLLLVDAPCGAFAASLSLLLTIAHLREVAVLPRTPLDVTVLGAEISPFAMAYGVSLFDLNKDHLAAQGIFVTVHCQDWDVTCQMRNTKFISEMNRLRQGCANSLLTFVNFSGFLMDKSNYKKAESQIEEILRYAAIHNTVAIWLEPNLNKVTNSHGLFTKLSSKFLTAWSSFIQSESGGEIRASGRFVPVTGPMASARVHLVVKQFDLGWQK